MSPSKLEDHATRSGVQTTKICMQLNNRRNVDYISDLDIRAAMSSHVLDRMLIIFTAQATIIILLGSGSHVTIDSLLCHALSHYDFYRVATVVARYFCSHLMVPHSI